MYRKITQVFLPLLLLLFFSSSLSAQIFQELHAFDPGTGLETGAYHDVASLNAVVGPGINMVAIGTSNAATQDGVTSYNDPNGVPLFMFEWRHPAGNPIEGKSIAELPSGDVVLAFYDAGAGATDVVRVGAGGGILWQTRLPDFRVQDIDADAVPYPGGEGIFLTGQSLANQQLSIQGLDAGGAPVFQVEYFLADPIWNYNRTTGYEVEFDAMTNHVVVVGTANIAGLAQTSMLFVRVDLGGGWILGRSYTDPNGNDYYHGKALVQHPLNPGHYLVGFEYSPIATQPFDRLGVAELDPGGNIVWINYYVGAGLFNSTNYILNGIKTNGSEVMVAGWFMTPVLPGNTAYTMSLTPAGFPIQFNEYTTGSPYPPAGSIFWGMDYNPVFGTFNVVGQWDSQASPGGWPQGPNPRSFWLVGTDPVGNSKCSNPEVGTMIPLNPAPPNLWVNKNALPAPVPSPIFRKQVDQRNTGHCSLPKRAFAWDEAEEAESAANLRMIHATDGTIYVELTGDVGEGLMQIVDLNGKVLLDVPVQAGKHRIDSDKLSSGVYFLRYAVTGIGSGAEKLVIRQ